jgi:hypothetical protein
MISGLNKDQTSVALLFRDLFTKGNVPDKDWEWLYRQDPMGLSLVEFKAAIRAEPHMTSGRANTSCVKP